MRAPFPWFGGKSRCAAMEHGKRLATWETTSSRSRGRSLFCLRAQLRRTSRLSTTDCYLANFWRCAALPGHTWPLDADWPVSELTLHARHSWLLSRNFRQQMRSDPDYCDPKIAGWWVWGHAPG